MSSRWLKLAAVAGASVFCVSSFGQTWSRVGSATPFTDYPTGTNGTTTQYRISIGTTAAASSQLYVLSQATSLIPLIVNTPASPTVDLAQFQAGSATKFVIKSTGSVGIGTTTVGSLLQVNGGAAIGYLASTAAPTNGLSVSGNSMLGGSLAVIGNVGIGSPTTGSKFQVNGGAAIGYSASTVAPTNGLVVSGHVGIGTSTPSSNYNLHVPAAAVQFGPDWYGTAPWYMLGVSNTNTTGNLECILNLNSQAGQTGIELFRAGAQKWYIYNNSSSDALGFYSADAQRMQLDQNGTLRVPGAIKAGEVFVTTNVWADYVFKKDYKLRSLAEVDKFIQANGHLPGIPGKDEVKEVSVGAMQVKLLEKIEEITLHMIQMEKENAKIQRENAQLRELVAGLSR